MRPRRRRLQSSRREIVIPQPARLLSLGVAALALLLPASARADNPILTGTVGPGFSISLTGPNGKPVEHLDPGTYTIVVNDLASIHNFRLSGPGVDESTDVDFVGTVTWTVTFTNGKYTYNCDPHYTTLVETFTVGTPAAAAPAAKPQKPAAKPKTKKLKKPKPKLKKKKTKPKPRYGYSY